MARFVLFLILLVPLTMAGNWLMEHPGQVTITWLGYDVTLHTAIVALLLLIAGLLIAFISLMLWQLATWGERRRARKRYRTLSRGITQLTRGVTALALGDEAGAQAALKKAIGFLPDEPLPQLLTAQLLQRQGKQDEARQHLRALMQHELTAELATRRLIEQHIAAHEWHQALSLAEQAQHDAPKDRWLALMLIDLYAREHNTTRMLALTEGWQWQSPLTKEERHRYAALAHYLAAQKEENPRRKSHHLRQATNFAPEFLPATIAYAQMLLTEDSPRRARKWLREAWLKSPNTLLITPILATMADETPRVQARLLKPFLRGELQVVHHLLSAQQALAADMPERAKADLELALALEENKSALALMAEVEKELHGNDAAHIWLARAMDAPAAESWICGQCGAVHAAWQTHCSNCGHFDRLRYERPESRITSVAAGNATEFAPVPAYRHGSSAPL